MQFQFGSRVIDFSQPKVMGILNVTPDSFSDGGACYKDGVLQLDLVLRRAEQMVLDGAAFLDVGGESTRPGAADVSADEECQRVLPVVSALSERFDVVISVDTSTPLVMTEAARCGAGFINDVRALRVPGALEAAKESGLPVCLMHMKGQPRNMQALPEYDDVVSEVLEFLCAEKNRCATAGIVGEKIWVDPGIGFGKNDDHNLALIRNLSVLQVVGPVLLGVSRKSMFGRLLGRDVSQRLSGSLAVGLIGCQKGAKILRVHDVAETVDALKMWQLIG